MTYYYNNQIYETKTSAQDEVNEFLHRYEATAGLSQRKLYARRVPIRYNDWLKDGGPIPFEQSIEREPMVEMYIPQDRFRDLIEKERWMGKLEEETQFYKQKYLSSLEESQIRAKNATVKKAYEKYKMLLEMAR